MSKCDVFKFGAIKDAFIPSQKSHRLNISDMIDRSNRYEGFSTTENITADKVLQTSLTDFLSG